MYLAAVLNSRGFFQRTAAWMTNAATSQAASRLLGHATAFVVGLSHMEAAQRACIQEFALFESQLPDVEDRFVFSSENMVALQNEISPLLSRLRIMQDGLSELIGRQLGVSLPQSLKDVVLSTHRKKMPSAVHDAISQYWSRSGKAIRDYRVLDQHYGGLAEHVFLQVKPSRKVLLLFPDDPNVRSKNKQTFNDEICGISAVRAGFDELHGLCEQVAQLFGFAPTSLNTSIHMSQLGELVPPRKRLLGFIFENPISRKADGSYEMNIRGMRISHTEQGTVEIQQHLLTEEQLKKLKGAEDGGNDD